MRLVIDSKGASGSLHLKISGFTIEFSDVSATGNVSVIEDSGNVSVEILPVKEVLINDSIIEPLVDDLQKIEQSEPLSKAVPEFPFFSLLFFLNTIFIDV